MKHLNKILAIFLVVFTLSSCEDYLGGDINADPNNPTSVPVTAQFPAIQIAMADVYGGDFSRFNSMLVQQTEGVARQWSSFNQYTGLTPNRFDSAWQNIYENILNELKIARASALEAGLNHHKAVIDIMEAWTIMTATDVWDDMPYASALQGISDINPAYDSQASIYTAAYALLSGAESLLAGPAGALAVGSEDVFFGGDVAKWTKTVSAIRARGLLHEGDYSGAMAAANASYESAGDNFAFQYPDANNAGGWYRFNRDRTGDLEFHPTLRGIMTDLGDTERLAAWDQTFITDHTYMVANFVQELVSYREMQFIIAECAFRNGNNDASHAALTNGVVASFERTGLTADDAAAYWAAGADPGVGGLSLESIMTQKYIAMFLQPEAYSDYRRTNIPALTPVSGTSVPVRWDYSADEYLFNSNSPSEGSVSIYTDRVGWNR